MDSLGISLVGQVVLLRISEEVRRPLLVVSIDGASVRGELFVDFEKDWPAPWLVKNCFFPPDQEHRTVWVKAAKVGPGIGEWEPIGAQAGFGTAGGSAGQELVQECEAGK